MCHKSLPFTSWNNLSCACAFYFDSPPPLMMIVPVTDFTRRKSPPKKKTVKPVYRQQGKQTPLIMSIKSQFPLSLAYACLGDHRDTFYRIVEPIPMHDLSFCHCINQTTILADIGVGC